MRNCAIKPQYDKQLANNKNLIFFLQSPDGLTVVSAGADETLRFWNVFGPPVSNNYETDLDNLLSLKVSPIR